MENMKLFFKKEPVLGVSLVLALLSCAVVKPDVKYISYCNFSVLSILFCLMTIVAGFKKAGVFVFLAKSLSSHVHTEKNMIIVLCMICFFISALITNDVSLITFVPFTIALMSGQKQNAVIFAVTMETVSANLGSLVTPIGNPQNLFLYTYYNMTPSQFFAVSLPLGLICLVAILCILLARRGDSLSLELSAEKAEAPKKSAVLFYTVLFALCIMTVLRFVPYGLTFAVVAAAVLIADRRLFLAVDFILLLTFVCFFVFVGNAERIPAVYENMSRLLSGREIAASAFLCQFISNVPAAAMLCAFTKNSRGLLIGTNIGGLGTLIASMASLISFRYISTSQIDTKKYIVFFSLVNFLLLAGLLLLYKFI